MRNISSFVGGLLAASIAFFGASRAFASPCEREPDAECHEYETYLVPGAQAVMYRPAGVEEPYFGGGASISVVRWSHQNDDFGPAEGNVYVQASLLDSASSSHVMGIYEAGVTLSFERNPRRRYLIPYFGMTSGGIVANDLRDSGFLQPLLGVHLFSHPNVQADLQGGYVFPTADVDRLHGFRAQASLRVHMW